MNAQFGHVRSLAIVASFGALWLPAAVKAKSEPVVPAASCGSQQPTGTETGALTGTWVSPAGRVEGGYSVALPTLGSRETVLAPCDAAGPVDLQIDALLRAAGIVGTSVTPAGTVEGGYGVALPILATSG